MLLEGLQPNRQPPQTLSASALRQCVTLIAALGTKVMLSEILNLDVMLMWGFPTSHLHPCSPLKVSNKLQIEAPSGHWEMQYEGLQLEGMFSFLLASLTLPALKGSVESHLLCFLSKHVTPVHS